MQLNRDYSDLLSAFANRRVRFLLVGAYALAYHSARATRDLDVNSVAEATSTRGFRSQNLRSQKSVEREYWSGSGGSRVDGSGLVSFVYGIVDDRFVE